MTQNLRLASEVKAVCGTEAFNLWKLTLTPGNRSVSNYSKRLDKSDNLLGLCLPGDFPLLVLHILAPTELATFWSVPQLSFENLLVVLLRLILGFLDALLSTSLLYSFILLKHILQ